MLPSSVALSTAFPVTGVSALVAHDQDADAVVARPVDDGVREIGHWVVLPTIIGGCAQPGILFQQSGKPLELVKKPSAHTSAGCPSCRTGQLVRGLPRRACESTCSPHFGTKFGKHVVEPNQERRIQRSFSLSTGCERIPSRVADSIRIQAGHHTIEQTNAVGLRQLQELGFKDF